MMAVPLLHEQPPEWLLQQERERDRETGNALPYAGGPAQPSHSPLTASSPISSLTSYASVFSSSFSSSSSSLAPPPPLDGSSSWGGDPLLLECCRTHTCHLWYDPQLKNDLMEKFYADSTLTLEWTKAYLNLLSSVGTLKNGKVFVATSDLAQAPMLGLFAAEDILKGSVVTAYHGSLR